ncbi:MAG: TlpA family protein disulfide reductase [Actinomycetota bacterium]
MRNSPLRRSATLVALLTLCSCGSSSPVASRSASPSTALEVAAAGSLHIGSIMPKVSSEAVEGPPISLADFRGRPFLINFWASSCEPCVQEFPLFLNALIQHSDLPIIGVDELERKAPAIAFINKENATWPSIWDPDGSIAQKQFGVRVLPVTLAVGRNFKLVDRHFGQINQATLNKLIEEIYRSK